MVKRSIYVIILLLVASPLFAKSQKEFLKEYNDSCFEAAQKKIALGKSRELCKCMTLNYKYLAEKAQRIKKQREEKKKDGKKPKSKKAAS